MSASRASPYTNRNVLALATPMIVSNVTVPLLGLVDTAVMGHLDSPRYLAAVAIGATIFSFIFMGLNFLRMGTTGLAAQARGANDAGDVRTVLAQAVLIALGMAAVLIVLQNPVGRLAMWLLAPEPDVLGAARIYYDVRIWAAPAALTNFALVGWFIGMQNTRAPLYLMLVTNLTNIALSVLLVVGLGYRTGGVAAASVIAEFAGLAFGGWLVHRELSGFGGRLEWPSVLHPDRLRRIFSVNANLLLRTLSLMFVFGFVTAQGARQGAAILAANAILLQFQFFMAYALDGFAHAAEALVGRALGEKNDQGFREAVRLSLIWSAAVALLFALFYAIAGRPLIALLTGQQDLRALAAVFLPWMVVSPLVSFWSFLFDGVFVGATWAREMRNTMIVSTFLVFLPTFYLTQALGLGNHGLWLAFVIFMISRAVTMGGTYLRLAARAPG
ncbi:MAG: MATE family efflux transporter [Gammaproteobacteria bacterium]|nr:MAG: MATE family efflux transporter [Gammaproteobacteria bacterium]